MTHAWTVADQITLLSFVEVMGRLDALIDLVYERYKDRFFPGEKVFVDLAGDKYACSFLCGQCGLIRVSKSRYFARIAKVFPPAAIRALAAPIRTSGTLAKPVASTSTTAPLSALSPSPAPLDLSEGYASLCHKIGVDLSVEILDAKKDDDPDDYLYTVQLMDEEHKFEGSFMEVKTKALRHV